MWKVYVGNLEPRIREREIADEFRVYGNVRSVWVARNPPGYAFVEFDDRRDAEDSVSRLDGKHGWRVEMSRKSVGGGRGRPSYGSSESKCYDCGGIGHFARECRSRLPRYSRQRSPSPVRRSDSHRHGGLARSGRGGSRSPPRYDRRNSYRDRSSPRRKRERSRSLESDKSNSKGHRGKGRKYSTSPEHGKSDVLSPRKEHEPIKSPQNSTKGNDREVHMSPQNGESIAREALSPHQKKSESIQSLSSERSDDIGGELGEALGSQIKRSESSKSLASERSEDIGVGDIEKEGFEHKGTLQGEESNIARTNISPVTREDTQDSMSPQPENNVNFADGGSPLNGGSPVRNGSASISTVEENNGSYPDRSPAEDLAEEEHPNGESD